MCAQILLSRNLLLQRAGAVTALTCAFHINNHKNVWKTRGEIQTFSFLLLQHNNNNNFTAISILHVKFC